MRYLIILFLLIATPCYATNYCEDASIEACWLFDEGTGTSIADSSSNGITGTTQNTPTWSTTGLPKSYIDSSLILNGSTQWVSFGNNITAPSALTIVAWVKLGSTPPSEWGDSVVNRSNSGTRMDYEFAIQSDDLVYGYDTSGTSHVYIESDTSPAAVDTWAHYAVTVASSGGTIIFYKDGSSVATTSGGVLADNGSDTLAVGATYQGGNDFLDAEVTETAIFSRVLTSTEISDIYNNGLEGGGAAASRRVVIVE